MSKPRLLDLFCGAGGAAMGYARAGFEVVGVDIKPQPHYPFEFMQADALDVLAGNVVAGLFDYDFDAVHASPPCQDHMRTPGPKFVPHGTGWLLDATRKALEATGLPWVIENVPGAEMRTDFKLCGCMFNLPNLRRERWFETSWHAFQLRPPCHHTDPAISVVGHGTPTWTREKFGRNITIADWRRSMDIDWMTRDELAQAIPPAYTEYIGGFLMAALRAERAS